MSTTSMKTYTPSGHNLSFGGIIWSEWVKLRSIRSTWWLYGMLLAITIGLGWQLSSSLSFGGTDEEPTREAVQALGAYANTTSTDFTSLIVSILAVLFIAGEYGSGMIGSTLMSVPKRVPALLGKALVFAVATFAVTAVAVAITVPISTAVLSATGIHIDLSDSLYWSALFGGVVYLVLMGLIAFSIGAILRSTAGGIAAALGLSFVVPLAVNFLGGGAPPLWAQNLRGLLPTELGKVLFGHPGQQAFIAPGTPVEPVPAGLWVLEPWQAGLALLAWVIVLLGVAGVLLKRRDA